MVDNETSDPPSIGRVSLLGAGPGDPGLVTLRAVQRLQEAEVVLYDALVHPVLLEHCDATARKIFVGKRAGRVYERQESINQQLLEFARAGLQVVRLKGGDPYLFGRGSEEAECLAAAGIPFEVVPGVPSALAATAYAGISLTHRKYASSVAYVTGVESDQKRDSTHDWQRLATGVQTLVIFMGLRKLDEVMGRLMDHGRAPETPAAVISRASLPTQQTVVGTVRSIASRAREAGIAPPALTVVGDVVNLRRSLRWYDTQPLFGKRILLTRPDQMASEMAAALRQAGADPVSRPTIRIQPPADPAPLREAARSARESHWVVLTSINGVRALFGEIEAQGGDARWLGTARVAAIGPATAAALASRGVRADLVPPTYRGEAVARAIIERSGPDLRGSRVLLPRASIARDALPRMLREAGATVDVVAAYQSVPGTEDDLRDIQQMLLADELDVVTFTSPSTVQHLVTRLDEAGCAALRRCQIAAIGPITASGATQHGLRVDVVATEYTATGLVRALEQHQTRQVIEK